MLHIILMCSDPIWALPGVSNTFSSLIIPLQTLPTHKNLTGAMEWFQVSVFFFSFLICVCAFWDVILAIFKVGKWLQETSQESWNNNSAGSHLGGHLRGSESEADSSLERNITLKTDTQCKQQNAYKICSPVDK